MTICRDYGKVHLRISETREEMGQLAADDAASAIMKLLSEKESISCIFAAAPSQNEFLAALARKDIPWDRIDAYHMDEYAGFGIGHKDSFNWFLTRSIFSRVPFRSVNLIDGSGDPEKEAERYGALLDQVDVDITFMGIGENGHIAFNDPGAADFNDAKTVKTVRLDSICRQQQVNDKCFPSLDDVPEMALTVTIPKLVSGRFIFCIVPTEKKHNAVKAALTGPVSESCPASVLRVCGAEVNMYIDRDCAGDLDEA